MQLPTDDEIIKLHKRLAKDQKIFSDIYVHCQIVAEIADELIQKNNLNVNKALVHASALLHDVGGYTFDDIEDAFKNGDYITHAIRGYEILKEEGYDNAICEIVRNHVGVGVTKKNIIELKLHLPLEDYTPKTAEQELVMYADKFHSKFKQPVFNSPEWYKKNVVRFGSDHPKKFQALIDTYGVPDIMSLSKKYNQPIRGV